MSQQPAWPEFDSPVLSDIATSLRRRAKAIRYHARLSCERQWEEGADGTWERLNVDVVSPVQLRLSVWCDGRMWLRVCQAGPGRSGGWAFMERFGGDVQSLQPAQVVERLEATLALCSPPRGGDFAQALRELWSGVRGGG